MNPPTIDNIAPNKMSLIKGRSTNATKSAPMGSLIPETKDYPAHDGEKNSRGN